MRRIGEQSGKHRGNRVLQAVARECGLRLPDGARLDCGGPASWQIPATASSLMRPSRRAAVPRSDPARRNARAGERQSAGCVSCHTATDSASMHPDSTGDHWLRRLSWRRSECDGGGRAEIGRIHRGDAQGACAAEVCRRRGAGRSSDPRLHSLASREPGVGALRESRRLARCSRRPAGRRDAIPKRFATFRPA